MRSGRSAASTGPQLATHIRSAFPPASPPLARRWAGPASCSAWCGSPARRDQVLQVLERQGEGIPTRNQLLGPPACRRPTGVPGPGAAYRPSHAARNVSTITGAAGRSCDGHVQIRLARIETDSRGRCCGSRWYRAAERGMMAKCGGTSATSGETRGPGGRRGRPARHGQRARGRRPGDRRGERSGWCGWAGNPFSDPETRSLVGRKVALKATASATSYASSRRARSSRPAGSRRTTRCGAKLG